MNVTGFAVCITALSIKNIILSKMFALAVTAGNVSMMLGNKIPEGFTVFKILLLFCFSCGIAFCLQSKAAIHRANKLWNSCICVAVIQNIGIFSFYRRRRQNLFKKIFFVKSVSHLLKMICLRIAGRLGAFIKLVKAVIQSAIFNRQYTLSCFFVPAGGSLVHPFTKLFGNVQGTAASLATHEFCNLNQAVHQFMHCVPRHPGICLISFFKLIKLKLGLCRICHCCAKNEAWLAAVVATTYCLTFCKAFNQSGKTVAQAHAITSLALPITARNSLRGSRKVMPQSMTADSGIFPAAIRSFCLVWQPRREPEII